jgi:hypothetical protein
MYDIKTRNTKIGCLSVYSAVLIEFLNIYHFVFQRLLTQ